MSTKVEPLNEENEILKSLFERKLKHLADTLCENFEFKIKDLEKRVKELETMIYYELVHVDKP